MKMASDVLLPRCPVAPLRALIHSVSRSTALKAPSQTPEIREWDEKIDPFRALIHSANHISSSGTLTSRSRDQSPEQSDGTILQMLVLAEFCEPHRPQTKFVATWGNRETPSTRQLTW